jgi:hypothetical protein
MAVVEPVLFGGVGVSTAQEDPMRQLVDIAKRWLETGVLEFEPIRDGCIRDVRALVQNLTVALEMRLVRIASQEREAWDQYAASAQHSSPSARANEADQLLEERRKRFGISKP